eukprot:SAG11_NODE_52_length_19809_cov_14.064231_9_plen_191_part_00
MGLSKENYREQGYRGLTTLELVNYSIFKAATCTWQQPNSFIPGLKEANKEEVQGFRSYLEELLEYTSPSFQRELHEKICTAVIALEAHRLKKEEILKKARDSANDSTGRFSVPTSTCPAALAVPIAAAATAAPDFAAGQATLSEDQSVSLGLVLDDLEDEIPDFEDIFGPDAPETGAPAAPEDPYRLDAK